MTYSGIILYLRYREHSAFVLQGAFCICITILYLHHRENSVFVLQGAFCICVTRSILYLHHRDQSVFVLQGACCIYSGETVPQAGTQEEEQEDKTPRRNFPCTPEVGHQIYSFYSTTSSVELDEFLVE